MPVFQTAGVRRAAALLVFATALAAGPAACGGGGQSHIAKPSAVVEYASLVTASKLKLGVWRDPATGELAFRLGHGQPVEVLIGGDVLLVPDDLNRFASPAAAWAYVENLYGVTRTSVERSLKHAMRVRRPSTMVAAVPEFLSTTTVHYETLADLRKAVHFIVPDPGLVLNGYRRFDLQISRGRPPQTPGPTVDLWYQKAGGTADVEVTGVSSQRAQAIRAGMKSDVGQKIVGPHFVATSGDDHYEFLCGDAYVDVGMYVPTIARWRSILTQVARDCPAA